MWNTGNSRQLALTTNGAFETRFADNGIGFSLLGNYAQGAPPNEPIQVTAQNLQGRVRYDRYILPNASFFLIETGRHDLLQGIDLRNNLDPGFKYLFFKAMSNTLWAEVGYDLQHDIRRNGARTVVDELGNPVLDDNGQLTILPKTETDHSARVYLGYKHAFNEEVTLSTGLEYLQSFVHSTRNRINYDALFAAKVGGGLAVGLGFSLRYDHDPLPDKKQLDTATTVSLIYSFSSDAPKAVEAPACPVYECEAVPPNAPFVNEPSTPATPAPELPAPEPADQPPVAPTPQ
jgi:putative salt-induced outer membrane protein YdiY